MAERAPRGEVAVMVAVQSALVDRPGMLATARGLSHFGEHCIGWLILALLGAIALPRRRREWLVAGAGAFVAHAIAVLIKRLVRRQRPDHPAIAVNVDTPSQLSFPSAHATSTTAAACSWAEPPGCRYRLCWCRRWRCREYCWGSTTPVMWPWVLLWAPPSGPSWTASAGAGKGPGRDELG